MTLVETSKKFERIIPEWASQLQYLVENGKLDREYEKKLSNYPCCIVGTLREKLSMPRKYWRPYTNLTKETYDLPEDKLIKNKDYCEICSDLADEFYELIDDEDIKATEPEIEEHLLCLKNHMHEDHGKDI